MDADVRAEFAGALVLLGAFRAARVEVGEYTERIRQRVGAETEKEPPPPRALEEAAAAALEAVETDAVTVADYTAAIKPKGPSAHHTQRQSDSVFAQLIRRRRRAGHVHG